MDENFFAGMGQEGQQKKQQQEQLQQPQISQQQEGQLQQDQMLSQQQRELENRLRQEQFYHLSMQQRLHAPQQQQQPQPSTSQSRKRKTPVKDEDKNEAYWQRRLKNNEAAKRSRDHRRMKEAGLKHRLESLEEFMAVQARMIRRLKERLGLSPSERVLCQEEVNQIVAEVRQWRESNTKLDDAQRTSLDELLGITELHCYVALRGGRSSGSTEASSSPPQNGHCSRGSFKEEDCFASNSSLNSTPSASFSSNWPSQQQQQQQQQQQLFTPTGSYSATPYLPKPPLMYSPDPSATAHPYFGRTDIYPGQFAQCSMPGNNSPPYASHHHASVVNAPADLSMHGGKRRTALAYEGQQGDSNGLQAAAHLTSTGNCMQRVSPIMAPAINHRQGVIGPRTLGSPSEFQAQSHHHLQQHHLHHLQHPAPNGRDLMDHEVYAGHEETPMKKVCSKSNK